MAVTLAESQAISFANMYASICLKNLTDLELLRGKLGQVPKLPHEKAENFLAGRAGDAWPVPDPYGTYVLALPTGKNLCLLYARRADTEAAKREFLRLVSGAPSPFVAKKVEDELRQTAANGQTQTITYEWSVPNLPRKLVFMLTIAPSETAQLQVLGSASIVQQ